METSGVFSAKDRWMMDDPTYLFLLLSIILFTEYSSRDTADIMYRDERWTLWSHAVHPDYEVTLSTLDLVNNVDKDAQIQQHNLFLG